MSNFAFTLKVDSDSYDRLLTIIRNLPVDKRRKIIQELQKSADRVFADSQKEVPVRTGALKGSARVEPEINERADRFEYSVIYGDDNTVTYPWHVEFGTEKMNPQPFLGPPFEAESQRLVTRIGKIASEEAR